ncbi:uncharacterized protein OCT59_010107 [Rhizophagus irregularis]|uniref:Uncharacterized protein n=1 Tax=Rhizophagus irregularis TaxID=588596 RepID=A0A915ZXQ7_9GLOM|nr:hypothetical protein OCT59_010107 [Rhizophagus irregularis]CAB4460313.1 unnamed protein product [Rhizophagus irregularis]CAB5163523.1 unnamed protein product [Rhizophagus irregularis]CAB5394004.1 unnamed protein product [Rhizophagus irregularis]
MKPTQGTLYINDLDLEFSRVPDIHGLDTHGMDNLLFTTPKFYNLWIYFPVTYKFFRKILQESKSMSVLIVWKNVRSL